MKGLVIFHSDSAVVGSYLQVYDRIVLVGHHEGSAGSSNKVIVFPISEISLEGMHSVCDSVMSAAKDFDLDVVVSGRVLDKAFNRSSAPGGLSTRELIYFLQRIRMLRSFFHSVVIDCSDGDLRSKLESALSKPL